jgi:DNA-binding beta-propeller fold protein YncE
MNTKRTATSIMTVMVVFAMLISPVSALLLPPAQTGDLFVLEEDSDDVIRITPSGQITVVITEEEIEAFTGAYDADFDDCGIAFDDSGKLFFSVELEQTEGDDEESAILRWSPGAGLSMVVSAADIKAATGALSTDIKGIAFGSDGFLYANDDTSDSVLRVDTTSNTVSVYVSKAQLNVLPGITSVDLEQSIVGGPGGMVYTASDGTPDAIFTIAPGGVPSVLTSGAPFLDLDVFMTRAPDGDLIICDNSTANTVYRVDPSTGTVSIFLTEAQILTAIGDPGQTEVDLEGGIAFDSQGYFYLAEEDSDNVLKFDSSGNGQIFVSESEIGAVTGEGDADLEAGIAFAPVPAHLPPSVPAMTPIGITALIGLLGLIGAGAIMRRR